MIANDNAVVLYAEQESHITVGVSGDEDFAGLLDRTFSYDDWDAADQYTAELMTELEMSVRYRLRSRQYPPSVDEEADDDF